MGLGRFEMPLPQEPATVKPERARPETYSYDGVEYTVVARTPGENGDLEITLAGGPVHKLRISVDGEIVEVRPK